VGWGWAHVLFSFFSTSSTDYQKIYKIVGFNFIYTMLMDLVTLSVVASDVFLRLSHTQTCTLRVGTFGADRGSRGLCTLRVGFGMLSSPFRLRPPMVE
jgi:hypothetical protein